MKNLLYLILITLVMSCQYESLDIQAPYRIKLEITGAPTTVNVGTSYALGLSLLTDSYYSKYGYRLVYYQQTGLGRLEWNDAIIQKDILQRVPAELPLGASTWWFTPEAPGNCQVVLVAQQERGYTQPDTLRLNFQVQP